jgi:hypothetical protein
LKAPRLIVFLGVAAFALRAAPDLERMVTAGEAAWEEYVASLSTQAYIYGFPLFEMYRTRYEFLQRDEPGGVRENQLLHTRDLLDASFKGVVAANTDTLYSSAWLDLAREPVILDVPDIPDRYYSVQLLDFYTNHFASISRTRERMRSGRFAIAGPGWSGQLPRGVTRIDAPTPAVWLIARILLANAEDKRRVHAIQDRFRLCALSTCRARGTEPVPSDAGAMIRPGEPDDLTFFETLNRALAENPPPPSESGLIGLFAKIGIGSKFEAAKVDSATKRGLKRGIATARTIISSSMNRNVKPVGHGWFTPKPTIARFGDDYLFRAAVAKFGIGANERQDAVYAQGLFDNQGELLGTQPGRYVLRFEKDQIPPANAFWSVTLYEAKSRTLIENALGRYSLGSQQEALRRGADGSIELYLQRDPPAPEKLSNWLPTPPTAWVATLRMYEPGRAVLDGTYRIPAIRRVAE